MNKYDVYAIVYFPGLRSAVCYDRGYNFLTDDPGVWRHIDIGDCMTLPRSTDRLLRKQIIDAKKDPGDVVEFEWYFPGWGGTPEWACEAHDVGEHSVVFWTKYFGYNTPMDSHK